MRSQKLRDVLDEISDISAGLADEMNEYKKNGDSVRHRTALLAVLDLMKTYCDLTSAADLLENMEDM